MLVRLGFAIAAHLDADVMLIDEVLAVGDEAFQRKCLRAINERILGGTTVVLVSHAPAAIERVCSRVVVLDGGRVVFDGPTAEGLLHYHELLGQADQPVVAAARGRPDRVTSRTSSCSTPTGRPRTVFAPGEPLTIALDIGVRAGATPTRIAFELRRSSGEPVFSTGHVVDLHRARAADLRDRRAAPAGRGLRPRGRRAAGRRHRPARRARPSPRRPDVEGVADLRGTWNVETAVVAR